MTQPWPVSRRAYQTQLESGFDAEPADGFLRCVDRADDVVRAANHSKHVSIQPEVDPFTTEDPLLHPFRCALIEGQQVERPFYLHRSVIPPVVSFLAINRHDVALANYVTEVAPLKMREASIANLGGRAKHEDELGLLDPGFLGSGGRRRQLWLKMQEPLRSGFHIRRLMFLRQSVQGRDKPW